MMRVAEEFEVVMVAVNYNSTQQSLALAKRFDLLPKLKAKAVLLLVDNSVDGHTGELGRALSESGSGVTCISPGINLGYFGGARFGLKAACSLDLHFRWLVVSNVDLQFDPEEVVARLAALDAAQIGIVAPNITSSLTGRKLNPYMRRRPMALRMHAYKWVYRFYSGMLTYEWLSMVRGRLHANIRQRRKRVTPLPSDAGEQETLLPIYAGHGSMLAFSQEYFRRGGSLEHAPFLFGEEISVAESARRIGLSVIWHPGISVEHAEHVSIGKLPGRQMHGFLREATAYCANSYF
jgi:GT2 family glycosyltransferase